MFLGFSNKYNQILYDTFHTCYGFKFTSREIVFKHSYILWSLKSKI